MGRRDALAPRLPCHILQRRIGARSPTLGAGCMGEAGKPLEGKVAIVTGGAKGIGFAVASDLARRGAAVVIADREGATTAAERLRNAGHRAVGLVVDVASEADTATLAAMATAEFGGIDIL